MKTINGKKNAIPNLSKVLNEEISSENVSKVSLFMFHFQVNKTQGFFSNNTSLHAVNFFDLNGEKYSCDITIQDVTNDFLPGIENIHVNDFIECFFDLSSETNPKSLFVLKNLLNPHDINIYQQTDRLLFPRLIFNVFLKGNSGVKDANVQPSLSYNGLFVDRFYYIQPKESLDYFQNLFHPYLHSDVQKFHGKLALLFFQPTTTMLNPSFYNLMSNFIVQFDKNSSSFKTTCDFQPFFKIYTKEILLKSANNADFIKNLMLLFDITEYSGYKNTHINVNILQNNTVLFTIIDDNDSNICDHIASSILLQQYSIFSFSDEFNHVFFDKDYANSFLVLQKTQETLSIKKVDDISLQNITSTMSDLSDIDLCRQNLVSQGIDNIHFTENNNQTFNSYLHDLQSIFQIQNYIRNFINNDLDQDALVLGKKLVDCYKKHHVLIDSIIVAKEPSEIYAEIISAASFNSKEFYDRLIKNWMNLLYVIGGESRLANELNVFIEHFKQQNPNYICIPDRDNIVKKFQELLTTEDVFVKYSLANQLMSFQDVLYFVRLENLAPNVFVENLVSKFSIDNTALENLISNDFDQLMLTEDPYSQAKSFTLVGQVLLYKDYRNEGRFSASLFPSDWLKIFCSVYFMLKYPAMPKYQNQVLFALDSSKGVLVELIQEDEYLLARPLSMWIRSKFSDESLTLESIMVEFKNTFIFFPNQNQAQMQKIFLSNLCEALWYIYKKNFHEVSVENIVSLNEMIDISYKCFFFLAVSNLTGSICENTLSHNVENFKELVNIEVSSLLNLAFNLDEEELAETNSSLTSFLSKAIPKAWYQLCNSENDIILDSAYEQFGNAVKNFSHLQIHQLILLPNFDGYTIDENANVIVRLECFLNYMHAWTDNYSNPPIQILDVNLPYIRIDVIETFSVILLKKFNFQSSKTNKYKWNVTLPLADNLFNCVKDVFDDLSGKKEQIINLILVMTKTIGFFDNYPLNHIRKESFMFSLKCFVEKTIDYLNDKNRIEIILNVLHTPILEIDVLMQYSLLLKTQTKYQKTLLTIWLKTLKNYKNLMLIEISDFSHKYQTLQKFLSMFADQKKMPKNLLLLLNEKDKKEFFENYQLFMNTFYRKICEFTLFKLSDKVNDTNLSYFVAEFAFMNKIDTKVTDFRKVRGYYESLKNIAEQCNKTLLMTQKIFLQETKPKLFTNNDVVLPIASKLIDTTRIALTNGITTEKSKKNFVMFIKSYQNDKFLPNERMSPLKAIMITDVDYYKNIYWHFKFCKDSECTPTVFYENIFFKNFQLVLSYAQNITKNVVNVYDNLEQGNGGFYVYNPVHYSNAIKNILWMEPCIRHFSTSVNELYDMSLTELLLPQQNSGIITNLLQIHTVGDDLNRDILNNSQNILFRNNSTSQNPKTLSSFNNIIEHKLKQTVVLNVLFLLKEFYKKIKIQPDCDNKEVILAELLHNRKTFKITAKIQDGDWDVVCNGESQILSRMCSLLKANLNKIYCIALLESANNNFITQQQTSMETKIEEKTQECSSLLQSLKGKFFGKSKIEQDIEKLRVEINNLRTQKQKFKNNKKEAENLINSQFDDQCEIIQQIIPIQWSEILPIDNPSIIQENIDFVYESHLIKEEWFCMKDIVALFEQMELNTCEMNEDVLKENTSQLLSNTITKYSKLTNIEIRNLNVQIACDKLSMHNGKVLESESNFLNTYYSSVFKYAGYCEMLSNIISLLIEKSTEKVVWLQERFYVDNDGQWAVKKEFETRDRELYSEYHTVQKEMIAVNNLQKKMEKQLHDFNENDRLSDMLMDFFQMAYTASPEEALIRFRENMLQFIEPLINELKETLSLDIFGKFRNVFNLYDENSVIDIANQEINKGREHTLLLSTIFPIKQQNNPPKTNDSKHVHKQHSKQIKP